MDCERLPFVPNTPNDDLVLLHQYRVSETYALHCHEFYEVFYVLRGQALHEIGSSSQVISEGTLVFIRPDDAHCYKILNRDELEFVNINIACPLAAQAFRWLRIPQEAFDRQSLPPSLRLEGAQHEEMQRKFLDLSRMNPGPDRRRAFCALIPEVLLLLYTRADMERTPVMPCWLTEVLQKLDEPACFTQGLPALLRMTSYTQEHLTRSFRRYVHTTPTAYINQKRLNYAASLLANRHLSPAEVAEQSGFHNLSHFYHLFRQQFGCTPLQYCARYQDEQSAQSRLLMAISRRAERVCSVYGATRIPLEGGVFAHCTVEGRMHIFLALEREVSEEGLAEVFARWDPRLTPGACLHINRENDSLFQSLCKKYGNAPVLLLREFLLTRERFLRLGRGEGPARLELHSTLASPDLLPSLVAALPFLSPESVHALAQPRGFVALVQGEIAGAVGISPEGVNLLVVLPAFRRRGIGTQLLRAAAAQFFADGGDLCSLSVPEQAQTGLAFARGLSLAQTGHEAIFSL
ncbi:MAG: GNAT family N-acetyltransferase [Candidatus Spyradocola sp.]|jgi:AraC family cel operon transcriptional repressor